MKRRTPASTAAPALMAPGPRRPTMKDVARLAGVHQTTVSLALRNHPGIPETTRARIRGFAEQIGYRPDPVLDAFNLHRLAHHPLRSAPAIAFISDQPSAAAFDQVPARREMYLGARAMAERMGFVFERFFAGPQQLPVARLNQILDSRGIGSAILASFSLQTSALPLDWSRLGGIKIESFHVTPALDLIAPDYRQGCREALSRLRALGYRRVGFVVTRADDERLAGLGRAGYLVETTRDGGVVDGEPLVLEKPGAASATALAAWIGRNRFDAVVSAVEALPGWLREAGYSLPADLAFASLELTGLDRFYAGIVPNHRLVGERAVELIAIRRYTHERGIPEHATVTYVPPVWRDGPSAPACTATKARRRSQASR